MTPRFPIAGVNYRTAQEKRRHLESGAWLPITAGESLREAAREVPDKPAVIAEDGTYSFRELDTLSESLAAGLIEAGLRPGDRAVFQIGAVKEIFVALFGCFKAGIVPLCTLPQYREIEIKSLGERSGANAYFVQGDVSASFDQLGFARSMLQAMPSVKHLFVTRGEAADALSIETLARKYDAKTAREIVRPHDPSPDDVIMFQLSGGSTGSAQDHPALSFRISRLGALAHQGLRTRQRRRRDVGAAADPQCRNAVHRDPDRGDAADQCHPERLRRREIPRRHSAPQGDLHRQHRTGGAAHHGISAHRRSRPVLASAVLHAVPRRCAGSAYRHRLRQHVRHHRRPADGLARRATRKRRGIAAAAAPVSPGDEIRLLKPGSEEEVAFGEVGELAFRGPSTLVGYFADPKANEAAFTSDGFFRTGDLLRAFEVNGVVGYTFEGRIKDNINRGGEKIGAEELENLIAAHPDVLDSRVVAMPDKIYGEKVCAYVVPRPGQPCPNVKSLGEFLLKAGIAKYKLPERIESIAAFPVTRVGKVDKAAMRADIAKKLADEEALGERCGSETRHDQIHSRSRSSAADPPACSSPSWSRASIPTIGSTCSSRIPSSATYGFGIVLADVALDFLKTGRSEAACRPAGRPPRSRTRSRSITAAPPCRFVATCFSASRACGYSTSCRPMRRARASTSSIRSGSTTSTTLSGYDLIVGADGVNSVDPQRPAARLPGRGRAALNKWAWYGTRHRFDTVELIFEQTPFGIFIAHSYRYAPDHGTFVIECHPDTWKRAGLDTKSDDESRRFCGEIFANYLDGEELISNRSLWFNPSFVTSKRWYVRQCGADRRRAEDRASFDRLRHAHGL